MKQNQDRCVFEEAYIKVQKNKAKDDTTAILNYIQKNATDIKRCKNIANVWARQLSEHEHVTMGDRIVQVKGGEWLIQQLNKTQSVLKPHEFEYIYEHEHPIRGTGNVKEYCLRKTNFWGFIYEGETCSFFDSRKKEILLNEGDVIGTYVPNNFTSTYIVIEKEVFTNNFIVV